MFFKGNAVEVFMAGKQARVIEEVSAFDRIPTGPAPVVYGPLHQFESLTWRRLPACDSNASGGWQAGSRTYAETFTASNFKGLGHKPVNHLRRGGGGCGSTSDLASMKAQRHWQSQWHTGGRLIAMLIATMMFALEVHADAPLAGYIYPAGAQRGTAVSARVGGCNLYASPKLL
jgi:hypothetical protein